MVNILTIPMSYDGHQYTNKKMENKQGRPKVFHQREPTTICINIIYSWRETFKKLESLASNDEDDEFEEYCKTVEGVDLSKKGSNKFSSYCRWILSRHVTDKLSESIGATE